MKSCWIVTKDHKNVLEFRDVPQPQPKAGEIVIKVHAAALCTEAPRNWVAVKPPASYTPSVKVLPASRRGMRYSVVSAAGSPNMP